MPFRRTPSLSGALGRRRCAAERRCGGRPRPGITRREEATKKPFQGRLQETVLTMSGWLRRTPRSGWRAGVVGCPDGHHPPPLVRPTVRKPPECSGGGFRAQGWRPARPFPNADVVV